MRPITDLRSIIVANAAKLREFEKAYEAATAGTHHYYGGPEALEARQRTCQEFHDHYDALAFPGGLRSGLQSIEAGDLQAIETAILYLELRPFHVRAQFNREAFTKLIKRQTLPKGLQERFDATREQLRLWREAARARHRMESAARAAKSGR